MGGDDMQVEANAAQSIDREQVRGSARWSFLGAASPCGNLQRVDRQARLTPELPRRAGGSTLKGWTRSGI